MRGQETIIFANNAAAGTYNMPTGAGNQPFIRGGRYLLLFACTGTPSLQFYMVDASGNAVKVGAAITTAGGASVELALPPGIPQIIVSTSTANYITLSRIPND
jgi:hypothetical protein